MAGLDYEIDALGAEANGEGFEGYFGIFMRCSNFKGYGPTPENTISSFGADLPFNDGIFDIVYCSDILALLSNLLHLDQYASADLRNEQPHSDQDGSMRF